MFTIIDTMGISEPQHVESHDYDAIRAAIWAAIGNVPCVVDTVTDLAETLSSPRRSQWTLPDGTVRCAYTYDRFEDECAFLGIRIEFN